MDVLPPTCEWTDRCYGFDDTPSGPIVVRVVRQGRQNVVEPVTEWPPVGHHAVATGLSEKEAWIRRVQTPLRSKKKVLQVLPSLLDVQLPFGIEECVISCVSLFRATASLGWTAIAVVARRTDLRARLVRWTAEGRDPHILDQEGLALWTQAVLEYPPHESGEPRAVIYLGLDRATLVFGRGDALIASQGLKRFDPGQALRQARLAFEGDPGTILWIWAGPGAVDGAAVGDIRRAMDRPEPARDVVMQEPRTVLARAYAIRALTSGPLRCDLRTDEFAHPAVARLRGKRATVAACLWLVAGIILLGGGLAWKGLCERRETQARQAVATRARAIIARLGGGQAINPGYEVRSVSNAMAAAEAQYAPFVRAQTPFRSRALGQLLMDARERKLVLRRFSWDETGLTLEGLAESEESCEAFLNRVETETGLTMVCRKDKKDSHGIRFVMETAKER
jgi:hypothetical protein